ncbi:thiaminase/transcriptional activator TenA [Microbacterium sp. SORGH_AS 1204]|uniref:hypothetical protein n=1 Tax=Microbacterium sp. SORGH_AS_1204 TaxID=3041785 RepID=UPI00278DD44B|nr:hypothetical protein [Microbacterium sp. SORGH_AS_1204]MDQ1136257.1 thiaminase/transcriptional activator TenA [Microbacterium sp. SORGH_AS_1204]
MTRSTRLLERQADAVAASAAHPLLVAMTDGTVPASVFSRYLALEGRFVETAAVLVERLLEDGPDPADEARLEVLLTHLRGDQRAYFDRAAGLTAVIDEGPDALTAHVLEVVSHFGTAAIPVCFAAAETLYASWCARAAAQSASRPAAVQEWIDLHTTTAFTDGVAAWLAMVDRLPTRTDVDDRQLDQWFSRMLAAEDVFHHSAYRGEPR